jgi:drug/metabolite transporter, DME family
VSTLPVHSTLPALGQAQILLAASLWGTTGTVRALELSGAGGVAVGSARLVVGGAVLMAVAVCTARGAALRRLLTGGRRTLALLALGAVCAAVYQCAFFAAVPRTGVATGTVVTLGSAPAFTGLLALLTGTARPSRRWTVATACAVLGCAALVGGGRSTGVEPFGVGLALISGFTYAAYATITAHLITRGEDGRAVSGMVFGGAAVLLVPLLLAGGTGWLHSPSATLAVAYLGFIGTAGAYLLYARGLRSTPVTAATTLTLAEPAVAAVLGLVVLNEHLGGIALGGLTLLTAGLVLLILPERRGSKTRLA